MASSSDHSGVGSVGPPDRGIPSSPAAAPAAGGGGIPDLRLVHSVGLCGYFSGGVVGAVARSGWSLLVAALFPSAAVAPRSSVAGRWPFWCFPSSDLCRWRIRSLTSKWRLVLILAMVFFVQGAGSVEPLLVDFPAVEGPLRLKASKGAVAAARRRLVFVVDLVGIQKDPFVISVFHLDLSIMFGV